MAVATEERETIYTASDGRKFEDKDAAEIWDAVVVAHEEMESAQRGFMHAVQKTWTSADGRRLGLSGHYYRVVEFYTSRGSDVHVDELWLWPDHVRLVDSDDWRDPEPEILVEENRDGRDPRRVRVRFSELYWRRENAEREACRRSLRSLVGERRRLLEMAERLGVDAGQEILEAERQAEEE